MTAPVLRFKVDGSSYPSWNEIKLKDCVNFSKGGTLSKTDLNPQGDVPCLLYGELYTTYGEVANSVISKTNRTADLVKSHKNDVLLPMSGETAEDIAKATCVLQEGVAYGGDLMVMRSNSLNGSFLSYSLNSVNRRKISRIAQGKTVVHINSSRVSEISINVPRLDEQQKIAAFFTTLDEKILLIDKTIASLNNLKHGLMDCLFKRRVRFNGKDGTTFGKWRLSTIGAEGTFYYGKSAPKWSLSDTATTPCIRYGDLYTKHEYVVKAVDTYTEIEREKLVFSKGGEVLVPRVGEDPLDFCKCAYLPMKNIAIGEMISVYETDNDGLYISYYFNSQMKKTFAKYVEGGNVSNLYYTYLEGIELEVPTIDEQMKISDFLSVLIEKIDVNKNKKENYIRLKRAFMQQMFV